MTHEDWQYIIKDASILIRNIELRWESENPDIKLGETTNECDVDRIKQEDKDDV